MRAQGTAGEGEAEKEMVVAQHVLQTRSKVHSSLSFVHVLNYSTVVCLSAGETAYAVLPSFRAFAGGIKEDASLLADFPTSLLLWLCDTGTATKRGIVCQSVVKMLK